MRNTVLVTAALLVALGSAQQARADVWQLQFNGAGISANVNLTVAPNVSPPDPNPSCGTIGNNPCRTDPTGAYMITGISGTFSDSNNSFVSAQPLNIVNAPITGLIAINPANERDSTFDPLVPASLSFIDYANESSPGKALSYNNLFFPNGSPIDCDYPFLGTFLDVFGMAFTIAGGDSVVLWGDGNYAFGPLTYGAGITDGINELDYQFSGVSVTVPEPGSALLLGAGLFGLLARRRKSDVGATEIV